MYESGDAAHQDAVEAFQDRLRHLAALDVVREVVTHGASAIIDDQSFAQLRLRTANSLAVSANRDVFMVGSAKLGFSLKQSRRYQPFGDDSDVDLAVVSPELYCVLWSELRRYSRQGGQWHRDDRNHFKNDHLNGVIKPHVLPDSASIPSKRRLFDLKMALQRERISVYPVTLAVWHSIDALEEYQAVTVEECQRELSE